MPETFGFRGNMPIEEAKHMMAYLKGLEDAEAIKYHLKVGESHDSFLVDLEIGLVRENEGLVRRIKKMFSEGYDIEL